MNNPHITEAAAMKLAELSREIEELENTRAALLFRVEQMRAELQMASQRTAGMRASVDLLCEHITNVVTALAEMRLLEEEIKEMHQGMADSGREMSGLSFEADSLEDTLDEAERELENLSSILIEGKARHTRGH